MITEGTKGWCLQSVRLQQSCTLILFKTTHSYIGVHLKVTEKWKLCIQEVKQLLRWTLYIPVVRIILLICWSRCSSCWSCATSCALLTHNVRFMWVSLTILSYMYFRNKVLCAFNWNKTIVAVKFPGLQTFWTFSSIF